MGKRPWDELFGNVMDIRSSVLDISISRCLSDIQVEISCRPLNI